MKTIKLVNSLTYSKAEQEVINTFIDEVSKLVLYNMFSEDSLNHIDNLLYGEGQDIIIDYISKVTLALKLQENIDIEDISSIIEDNLNAVFKDNDLDNAVIKKANNIYIVVYMICYLKLKLN